MAESELDEQLVATELLEEYGDRVERKGSPLWLELGRTPAGRMTRREVRYRDGLLGRRARPASIAAAVIGTGRLRMLDEAHELPARLVPGLAGGLRMACLVTRDDRVGWRMVLPGGATIDPPPEGGEMLDILRRALDLPTRPPAGSTGYLQMVSWVTSLLLAADENGRAPRLTWDQTIHRHPLFVDGTVDDVAGAEGLIRELAAMGSWESVRLLVAAGLGSGPMPSADLAGWMDEGMFSRWVTSDLPAAEALVAAVQPRLMPGAARRLGHLIREIEAAPWAAPFMSG